jgi:hypothetical protein
MEAKCTRLEALVTSMAAQVKSVAFGPRKARDRGDDQLYGSNADQGFFCGASFSGSMAPNEMMSDMSRDHESWATNDGNHVMVPNLNETISTVAPVIRASMRMPEPRGVDEKIGSSVW